jgi:hypothetical protein
MASDHPELRSLMYRLTHLLLKDEMCWVYIVSQTFSAYGNNYIFVIIPLSDPFRLVIFIVHAPVTSKFARSIVMVITAKIKIIHTEAVGMLMSSLLIQLHMAQMAHPLSSSIKKLT